MPRTDEFQGEYVPAYAERLQWLTGFTGSWGSACIGLNSAALIVDGRYTIQAAKEAPNFELLSPDAAALQSHFVKNFKKSSIIGFDPWLTSISETRRLKHIVEAAHLKLQATANNLVDQMWQDRPTSPANPIYDHPVAVAGETFDSKLDRLAKDLITQGCAAVVLTDPHSVAWVLNIRGSDVQHTPLALLRAILYQNGKVDLFAIKNRFAPQLLDSFTKHVTLRDPASLSVQLAKLAKTKKSVLLDPATCPDAIREIIVAAKGVIKEAQDPCVLPRARKNAVEQKGARNAQLRDGIALTNFLHWLDTTPLEQKTTERVAQIELEKFRKATGKLKDLSFGSISASGPNAALPHYHVKSGEGRTLKKDEIYLIDLGGQYEDGTTDVTRTVIRGIASAAMKFHFTLVLKGMIAVSTARFPAGTTGVQIDALARSALWQQGLDFDHGTGHGVGSYLSVHEGPARISKAGTVALEPGMILSNEPGYYLKGAYGIRIENLLLVRPPTKPKGHERAMLSFETLTFAPIDKRLIDDSILTRAEIQWIDIYHDEVWQKLSRGVSTNTKLWLKAACAPLTKFA